MIYPHVTLYTHSSCPDSPRVREWLVRHDIEFTERSLDDDPDAVDELDKTGRFATPLLVVGQDMVVGYRVERLRSLFNIGDGVLTE